MKLRAGLVICGDSPRHSYTMRRFSSKVISERTFSAIQPTGALHLGNYLGAIKNWVRLQDQRPSEDLFFCLADLHALTIPGEPDSLRHSILHLTAALIACGVSPDRAVLFQQSSVPQHSELMWMFSCLTPFHKLNSMTQFKTKSDQFGSKLGLFSYPVLMAADVLLYKACHVPVGEDQTQHIEFMRNMARSFNSFYKTEFFPIPSQDVSSAGRIMSLVDGTNKMSKSDASSNSRINLSDTPDVIAKKIRKAKTDSISSVYFDIENRPEISNLLSILSEMSDTSLENTCSLMEGKSSQQLKEALAEACIQYIGPISSEISRLENDPEYLQQILDRGRHSAAVVAENTIRQVKSVVGVVL